jgi:nitrite reductase/ring-hydroxylating ferredoxin subunit
MLKKRTNFNCIALILLATALLQLSCKKRKNTAIPYIPVNIYIYPSDPNFNKINTPGGWVYLNGGSRGIIVYRRSNEEFVAYDRHCTYDTENPCGQVEVTSSQISAIDSCCMSEFVLTDGSVIKSPATVPLQAYQVSYNGNELHIFN